MIYSQIIDLTTINKILKINKIYILTLTILLKMTTPIRKIQPNNKINLKTITIMSLLPKNLQYQHIIHHKQGHQHQYILTPLEFPLEL